MKKSERRLRTLTGVAAVLVAWSISAMGVAGVGTSASASAAKRGASCLLGDWTEDLQRKLVVTPTGRDSVTGTNELHLRRGRFLKTYSAHFSGETAWPPSGTAVIESVDIGAVSADYSTVKAGKIHFANVINAARGLSITSVNGEPLPPQRSTAAGSLAGPVDAYYSCRGDTLTLTPPTGSEYYTRIKERDAPV